MHDFTSREELRREKIPFWYSGLVHRLFVMGIFFISIVYLCLTDMGKNYSALILVLVWLYQHAFWYVFHRFVLHQPLRFLNWIHEFHRGHHTFYHSGNMIADKLEDDFFLLFPYQVLSVYALCSTPGLLVLFFLSGLSDLFWISAFLGSCLYYGMNELVHFLMHRRGMSFLSRYQWFEKMRDYHYKHHDSENHSKNFDFVFPFLDKYIKSKD